jgi:L-2-hydroxyglutarate oxidase LhgO
MHAVDCIVIGGGAIGLAIGRRMALAGIETLVLEREAIPGSHASSRNSEVIHSGIYYPPGSIKARLCVQGREQLYRYCAERGIAQQRCGKLIVATATEERATLRRYLETAASNGVTDLVELTAAEAATLEPELRCVAALLAPSTGIFDSHSYLSALIGDLERDGGTLACRTEVQRARLRRGRHRLEVTQDGAEMELEARLVVNAAGLEAQQVAARFEGLDQQLVPPRFLAKGHYFSLRGHAPFRRLVYPVANDAGLGIHATVDLAGAVRFGPDVEWVDAVDYRVDESRREAFAQSIRRYYPGLDAERLEPAYTGIRPKVAGPGERAADFMIQGPVAHGWEGLVNLYGIESPGLTASLAIADEVVEILGLDSRHV